MNLFWVLIILSVFKYTYRHLILSWSYKVQSSALKYNGSPNRHVKIDGASNMKKKGLAFCDRSDTFSGSNAVNFSGSLNFIISRAVAAEFGSIYRILLLQYLPDRYRFSRWIHIVIICLKKSTREKKINKH